MYLMMIESIALIGTIIFIGLFFVSVWFNLFLIRKLLYFNENFDEVNLSIDSFSKHLEDLYELPAFYGDDNLEKLLQHSRELNRDLGEFKNKYSQ
tara:strand:+ start:8596 stop:8880 length:285 start_codon:yes stop_codon:yes gene_type:complete